MKWGPAVSLTFDDGLPCQIEHAIPALNRRNMVGTFFLIQNSPYDTEFRAEVWRDAVAKGHEVGSHSVNHIKAVELTHSEAMKEARESQKFLEGALNTTITSFAYPYTDVNPSVRLAAKRHYKQARGGRVARENKLITPGDGVDLHNLPCVHVDGSSIQGVPLMLERVMQQGAWLILMFHGVGPDQSQWDNVTNWRFGQFLDALDTQRKAGLSIDTLGAVAERLRNA